jgi:5'-nucleotidase
MEAVSPVPDLVLSGINQGPNLGTDIIYSGTAAGARQAVLHGVPGIALSLAGLKPFFWDKTVRFAIEHLDEFVCSWQPDTFVNVNFPNTPDGPVGTAFTFPSHRIYHDTLDVYDASDGKKYCFVQGGDVETVYEDESDWDAVSRNLVSVCPVYMHPTGIK